MVMNGLWIMIGDGRTHFFGKIYGWVTKVLKINSLGSIPSLVLKSILLLNVVFGIGVCGSGAFNGGDSFLSGRGIF